MKSKRTAMGLLFVSFALLSAACSGPNRAASTPVVVPDGQPADQATDGGETQPGPTDAPSQVETLMAGELATQTAISGGQLPVEPTAAPAKTDAPVVQEPTPVPPTPVPEPTETEEPPPPQANCASPYTVQTGDWVWNIGRRCNIHPDSIIVANNLSWPFVIFPGDILILPTNAPPFPGP